MNLEENVQKYIKIEDEIKKRHAELHKLREYKTSITLLIIADLEKDKTRWEHIQAQGLDIRRWNATYGKQITIDEAKKWGVDSLITRSTKTNKMVHNNVGEVGCWMSHKQLLTHLATQNVPDNYGHLILEDDVDLHSGFMDEFEVIAKQIPRNWDMIYLSMNRPVGNTRLSSRILKANTLKNIAKGNWGTQAYMVRHGSIQKILKHLRFMTHAVDVQYNFAFDDLDAYIIDPILIKLNPILSKESTIVSDRSY